MKFEIDDKTGMIFGYENKFYANEIQPMEAPLATDQKILERILQAVKKTQEKLVNKQIQEMQDSKNLIDKTVMVTPKDGEKHKLNAIIKIIKGEIQDKNGHIQPFDEGDIKNIELEFGDKSFLIGSGVSLDPLSIEQNQRIVDAIISKCKELDGTSMEAEDRIGEMVCILKEITGKDIKDL